MSITELRILEFFDSEEIERMAREAGFVQRTSPITGMKFLLVFSCGLLNTPDGTLAQLAAFLSATAGTEVSPQALDERIHGSARDFLHLCLKKALMMASGIASLPRGVLDKFQHLYVIDSTNFTLHPSLAPVFKGSGGGASAASLRIQFAFDYRTCTMYVELGDVRLSDTSTLARWMDEGVLETDGACLFLFDLGYFKCATLAKIASKKDRSFLSKLQFGLKLKRPDGTELDLSSLLKKGPDPFDCAVMVDGLAYRLVGRKLPEEVVNRRIRKAREISKAKCKSGQITKGYRLFLGYALFLTNLPPEYDIECLSAFYRIRWQVELIFKVWKSILSIHRMRSTRADRVLCEVYGKLIVAAIVSALSAMTLALLEGIAVSQHKVARYFRAVAAHWGLAIMAGVEAQGSFLEQVGKALARFCKKTKQKSKPNIEQVLDAIFSNRAFGGQNTAGEP